MGAPSCRQNRLYLCAEQSTDYVYISSFFFAVLFAPLWVVLKKSEKRKFNVADTKNGWCVCLTFFSPSEHFVVTCLLFADVWMRKEHVAWSDDFVPYTFCCIFYLFCVCGTFSFVWVKVRARWGNCTTLCFFTMGFWFLSRSFLCAAFITRNPQVLIVMHRNVTPLLRRRMKIMTQRQITRRQLIHWLATPVLATLISLNSALFSISCSLILRA